MTELTAVMAAASTMTLESRAKRHPPSSSNGFPASSKETTRAWTFISAEGFLRCMALLMVIHAVCTFGCHAMLKAFEQTSNLWPSSHPPTQSTRIAGKSYCTSISFYHRIALLMCLVMCLCTTNPPLQKAWYTDGCLRVDIYHKGTLITIWRSWCHQGPNNNNNNMVTALSVSVWTGWSMQFGWIEWTEECSAPTPAHSSSMETLAAPDVCWTSLQMSHFCSPFSQMLCATRCRVQQQWSFMPR